MQMTLEFTKDGAVTRTASYFIPRKGTHMAIAATVVAAAPAAVANKGRFAFLLTAKDAVFTKATQGTDALTVLADKVGLGGAVRWLRARYSWAVQKAAYAARALGISGLIGLGISLLTTRTGQAITKAVVSSFLAPVKWAISKAYDAVSWFVRLFGKRGQRLAARMDAAVYGTIDKVVTKVTPTVNRIKAAFDPDSKPIRVAATIGKGLVAQALISTFLTGGWAALAYVAALPFVFSSLRWGKVKQAWNEAKAEVAVERLIAEATEAPKPTFSERIAAKKAAADQMVAATTPVVPVTVHTNSDGSVSIVSHVTDEQMAADGYVPTNEVQTLEDGTEVPIYSPATETLSEPVLTRNAIKAQRRMAAEAAAKENEARQKVEAAERRERAAAAKAAKLAGAPA